MPRVDGLVLCGIVACLFLGAQPASASTVLAWYDFGDTGNSTSNFGNARFDSIDTDPWTDASRLGQGGGLSGGDAGEFINTNPGMGGTTSGPQNLNVGHAAEADFDAATAADDYFSFTITPSEDPGYVETVYQSLTFFSNGFSNPAGRRVRVTLDGVEIGTITPTPNNGAAGFYDLDLGDFTSSDEVEIRFTIWGNGTDAQTVRFDDITLTGVVVPEPATAVLLLVGMSVIGAGGYSRRRNRPR